MLILWGVAGVVYCTVGVHPCSAQQFESHAGGAEKLLEELSDLACKAKEEGQCVAFGETGLDYDRLSLCPKSTQLEFFAKQLAIAVQVQLPLFLHSRAAHPDFIRLLREYQDRLPKRGVVHSFTGTREEMKELVEEGWYIGVNGCSLKTQENLEVVKEVPLERIMLETDGPWCEVRASHKGTKYLSDYEEMFKSVKKEKFEEGKLIKGRNEPCLIGKVGVVVAGVKGVTLEEVTEGAWRNTVEVFGLGEEEGKEN
jgi:TatD DNase family protein